MSIVTTNQKTPDPMPPENRRTFVKKSVATSVSISFVGLIRAAHGEETPGTTTTTYDPQQTTSPTSGQTTTFDPQQTTSPPVTATTTTVTTTPPPEAAAQFVSHDHNNSERVFFDIGDDSFMLKITYHAYTMNNTWWNNVSYYTYFSAVLKKKMAGNTGDYTGSVSAISGNGMAQSVTRDVDAHCDPEDGALSEVSTVSGSYNAAEPQKGWVRAYFEIGEITYKLTVLLVLGQTSSGANPGSGMYMITRDKGSAFLTKEVVVNGVTQDQGVASVYMEKNYAVKHWYPNLLPGADIPVDENNAYEEPDAALLGCHVKFSSKVL